MRKINTVAVLGANGSMGSAAAGLIAAFGDCRVHMLARDREKAREGARRAVQSIRSQTIQERLMPGSYEDNLEEALGESDWIFEAVAENYEIKENLYRKLAGFRKEGALVSTVSSGLDIARLAGNFDEDGKRNFYGTHFFNPPYKMKLCELIAHPGNDPEETEEVRLYLQNTLRRVVVLVANTPGFAANRIGFQFINEAALFAEKYAGRGGVHFMDALLGGCSGRVLPPLATADLVGLDVYQSVLNDLHERIQDSAKETFRLPEYMKDRIAAGALGKKTGKGLYARQTAEDGTSRNLVHDIESGSYVPPPELQIPFLEDLKALVHEGRYVRAAALIKTAPGEEADLLRYFLARYVSYAFSLVGEVADQDGIDRAMGYGFNWAPPSAWTELLGGPEEMLRLIAQAGLPAPEILTRPRTPFNGFRQFPDYRQFIRAV